MSINTEKLASELFNAYIQKEPITCFYDQDINIESQEIGYSIQESLLGKKFSENSESLKGYKIGLTTIETQKYYNTDEPFYGSFTDKNIIENGVVNMSEMFDPKVLEIEVVFFVDEDISMGADEAEIINKTRIGIGLEIPDSRYINWFRPTIPLGVIIADSGAAGKLVISSPSEYTSLRELNAIEGELYHNGEKIDSGKSTDVLGSPVNTVLWLIKKLAKKNTILKKGTLVSSGSMTMPKPIEKGNYKIKFSELGELDILVK